MSEAVPQDVLKRLKEHQYSVAGKSLLETQLQPFWNWTVEQMPVWLAPNLITTIGLIVNIFTSLLVVFYNPTASAGVDVPWWGYVLCAVGLFAYQLLDAIDGKQARRTGSASPLGELFDHGCDSMSTVFLMISLCTSLQLGPTFWTYLAGTTGIATFFTAHWRAYVSGTLYFGTIDVTEAQYLMIFVHLLSGFFGPSMWTFELFGFELKHLFVMASIFGGLGTCAKNIYFVLQGGPGMNGTTVAETSVISPAIPLGIMLWGFHYVYGFTVFEKMPMLCLIAFGCAASKVCIQLVLAHMSKSPMRLFDPVMAAPLFFFFNKFFGLNVDETIVLYIYGVFSFWQLAHYCHSLVIQVCKFLNIKCFTIPPPPPPKKKE